MSQEPVVQPSCLHEVPPTFRLDQQGRPPGIVSHRSAEGSITEMRPQDSLVALRFSASNGGAWRKMVRPLAIRFCGCFCFPLGFCSL